MKKKITEKEMKAPYIPVFKSNLGMSPALIGDRQIFDLWSSISEVKVCS